MKYDIFQINYELVQYSRLVFIFVFFITTLLLLFVDFIFLLFETALTRLWDFDGKYIHSDRYKSIAPFSIHKSECRKEKLKCNITDYSNTNSVISFNSMKNY